MKISKSKQELARIISENGGWHQLANLAFYGNFTGECFMLSTDEYPIYDPSTKVFYINDRDVVWRFKSKPLKNWHQTILSSAEYFHLYPAQDAGVNVTVENNTSLNVTVSDKPSIEQLASDYRNLLDFARRKQEEADDAKADADAAKADADARLKALELAGEAIGLLVSPITAKQEPELVITDWRDLRVGDVIKCVGDSWGGRFRDSDAVVEELEGHDYEYDLRIRASIGDHTDWGEHFTFIRRP